MIQTLDVKNFTLFREQSFSFGNKWNIIIGENGNGKTQILKLIYALAKSCNEKTDSCFPQIVQQSMEYVFHAGIRDLQTFGSNEPFQCNFSDEHNKTFIYRSSGSSGMFAPQRIFSFHPVFLPVRELLSIYPNFLSLSEKYDLPYDGTYSDTIKLLGLPYLKQIPNEFQEIVNLLESNLGGKIVLDAKGGRFYMQFSDSDARMDIDMTAEGWRKLGMLMQLLRVGALEKGTALFWDEPEANLNPKLIRLICEIIVKLGTLGIQVFLTTHSLFLVNEMELIFAEKKITEGMRYFNFYRDAKDKHKVCVEQSGKMSDLSQVLLLDESMKQSYRYLNEDL